MANSITNVGFGLGEYGAEAADIERRRAYAQALQQQGAQPMGPTEMAGGWAVRKSPLEGLAKMLQAYGGRKGQEAATEQQKALGERYQSELARTLMQAQQAGAGRAAEPSTMYEDASGNAAPTDPIAAVAPDRQAMARILMGHPATQAAGMAQMMPKDPKYHVVGGSLVAEPQPGQQGPMTPAFTAPKYHNVGGNLVPEPAQGAAPGTPIKPVYSAPEKDEAAKFNAILKGAGIDPASPAGQQLFQALAMKTATHQPAATTSVKVNSYLPASEEAQKRFMDSTRTTYDQLKHAPVLLDSLEKAKALIPAAKGFMGPGGEGLLGAAKFLNNRLGMKVDTEGVKSAEELRTRIFFNIMDNLKKMDAQPSQMQQQIMMESLGKLGTDPNALPRVLDAFGDSLRGKIDLHNKEVEGATAKGVKFPYDPTIKIKSQGAPAGGQPRVVDW